MSLIKFGDRLTSLGCTNVSKSGDSLEVDIDGLKIKIDFSPEWLKSINSFYRAKQYHFDTERRMLSGNKFVEFQVQKLSPGFSFNPYHRFVDNNKNEVTLEPGSHIFLLSSFETEVYALTFDFIKGRLEARSARRAGRKGKLSKGRYSCRVGDFFLIYNTVRYIPKLKLDRENLIKVGLEKIRSCLFNLAYSKNEAWEVRDDIKSSGFRHHAFEEETELEIPSANYDSDIVSHYKVAKSSLFPGQIFLSYYHILEYFFLQVADEDLFQAARAQLNEPRFKATYNNVTKLIATVKKNDNTGDEKKMLCSVLQKYVSEEDYIEFVNKTEENIGEKIISGKNLNIFGCTFKVQLEKGHALSNTASLLKHIRNSIVHSSDRHTREDCYQPFTESEEVVARYIPIIQFMSEKLIFATAE